VNHPIPAKLAGVVFFPDGRMDACNASKYIGLAQKTLAMLRCNGRGPKFIKRGRIFYFQADIDDWMKGGRIQSTAQAGACQRELRS